MRKKASITDYAAHLDPFGQVPRLAAQSVTGSKLRAGMWQDESRKRSRAMSPNSIPLRMCTNIGRELHHAADTEQDQSQPHHATVGELKQGSKRAGTLWLGSRSMNQQ